MEENTQLDMSMGRSINVLAFGDTGDELELAALDKAREFFGADARLRVIRNYLVRDLDPDGSLAQARGTTKAWYATVMVQEIAP